MTYRTKAIATALQAGGILLVAAAIGFLLDGSFGPSSLGDPVVWLLVGALLGGVTEAVARSASPTGGGSLADRMMWTPTVAALVVLIVQRAPARFTHGFGILAGRGPVGVANLVAAGCVAIGYCVVELAFGRAYAAHSRQTA